MIRRTAACLSMFLLSAAAAAADSPAAGHWDGEIAVPGQPLKVIIDLTEKDGQWTGTIDIPAQGLSGFALSKINVKGRKATFEMAGVPGTPTFEGTISDDDKSMDGTFSQGGANLKFALKRAAAKQKTSEPKGVPGEGLAANWQGRIDAGPVKLRVILKIEEKDGALSGTFISVDQGNAEIPLTEIKLNGRAMSFQAPRVNGSYKGTMSADGSQVEGTWSQAGQSMPLNVVRLAGEPETAARPQEPGNDVSYRSRDVTFPGGGDVQLAGTLTLPQGEGPFPAVALLSGSGPQDRDEALMGHRPFLVLADHLTNRGIAVLRFDDRGVGDSTGNFGEARVRDFTDDAAAAAAYLATVPEVDGNKLGLIGHSEGGITGPAAAARDDTVKFLVLLAGPGVPMSDLLVQQLHDLLRSMSVPPDVIAAQVEATKKAYALLPSIDGPDDPDVARLRELLAESNESLPAELREMSGGPAAVDKAVQTLTTPWFLELSQTDPRVVLRRVSVPVLAVNGGTDVQVAADENLAAIEAALREGGNDAVTVRKFEGLNHLFQHSESGSVAEYATIDETFAPEVLTFVSDWILETTGN